MRALFLRFVLAVLMLVGVTATTADPAAAASSGGMRIVSIYFDSPGSDTGSNSSLNQEWVHLQNITGSTVNLNGWRLRDKANHVFVFPNVSVVSKASIFVHTGSGTRTASNLYWGQKWYIWNNTGDTATVHDAAGTFVDHCIYTSGADPEAFC